MITIPRRRRDRVGDAGSTQAIALLIAAFITTTTIAATTTLTAMDDGGTATRGESAEMRTTARDVLTRVVQEPGFTHAQSTDWHLDPDDLAVFGLAHDGRPQFLSGDKILELRKGGLEADATNGRADYPEVLGALGIEDYDLHLRAFPLVYSVDDPRWSQYRGMEVGYVGQHERVTGSTAPDVTVTAEQTTNDPDYLEVTFTITCHDGAAQDVFLLTTRLDTGSGKNAGLITRNTHSPLMACGASADPVPFTVRWENLDWWKGSTSGETYELSYDLQSMLTNDRVRTSEKLDVTLRQNTGKAFTLSAESTRHHFVNDGAGRTETPTVILDKFARDGGRYADAPVDVDVTLITSTGGTSTRTATIPADDEVRVAFDGLTSADADAPGDEGTWSVVVRHRDGAGTLLAEAHERFTFTQDASQLEDPDVVPSALAESELDVVTDLVRDFERSRYPTGDVFRDHKEDTLEVLAYPPHGDGVFDNYDVMIIGSNANTQALSGAFAEDLRDWVEAGGTLIVLGSEEQGAQWLQSARAFDVHFDSASGGIGTPDDSHPLLTRPDGLRHPAYQNTGRTYRMTGDAFEGFTHVLVESYGDTEAQSILSISNPGVYGDGTVLFTSLLPTKVLADENGDEAKRLMNNLLSRSLDTLHMDYGPSIPEGVTVGSASRLIGIPHPRDPELEVEVLIMAYVWQ